MRKRRKPGAEKMREARFYIEPERYDELRKAANEINVGVSFMIRLAVARMVEELRSGTRT